MFCPVCDSVRMREVEKEGVLIDICPSCKGVWRDRGELEKLLEGERSYRREYPAAHEEGYKHQQTYDDHRPYREYGDDDYVKKYGKKHKKRRVFDILEDLFD